MHKFIILLGLSLLPITAITFPAESSVIVFDDLNWRELGPITVCASDGSKMYGNLFVSDLQKRLIYKFVFITFGNKKEELNVSRVTNNEDNYYNASVRYGSRTYYFNVPAW